MPSDPTILAFDTSAAHCAAALLIGGRIVVSRGEAMKKGQAERLMVLLEDVLAEGGIGWRDLDAIGVGVGPGNFTGIRISVAAARGLALGLGVPVYGVDGFAARREASEGMQGTAAVPAPRDMVFIERPGKSPEQVPRADAGPLPMEPGPRELAESIARLAGRQWPAQVPSPAPLYIRPADAAPSREAPPVLLD